MKRVVVTGLGAITPLGNSVQEFWDGIKKGKCGIDKITLFDATDFEVQLAAEVKNYSTEEHFERKEAKKFDRFSQFAILAAREAFDDAKLNKEDIDSTKFGVIISSGIGALMTVEDEKTKLLEKGSRRVSPMTLPRIIPNMAAGNVSIDLGAQGVSIAMVTACSSATHSIGEAYRYIKYGEQDLVVCGGSEACISPLSIAGFTNMTALTKNPDKNKASTPFDKNRAGFVMGEGCGLLILEELEHAQKRGAKIYAEMVGYGATSDAYHITSPSPDGEGAARAMTIAMTHGQIQPKDVSYINAHGTSTQLNDKYETLAMKKAFGEDINNIPISSTKGMTGHLLGATGGVEAIVTVMAIHENYVPATIGYETPDEECDLDYIPNVGRNIEVNYAMSNSLGFGGHNGSILFKKYEV